jgi:hypothetical protein
MKETRRDVSRNAELSSLQDDNPNPAGLGFLFFNPTMKLKLCRIEEERRYGAGFRPELETVLGKVRQVGAKSSSSLALVQQHIEPTHCQKERCDA